MSQSLHSFVARFGLVLIASSVAVAAFGQDLSVVENNDANDLAAALVQPGSGLSVSSATLQYQALIGGPSSTGLYSLSGPAPHTYNLERNGVVMSTGAASSYASGPNTIVNKSLDFGVLELDPGNIALLDPIANVPGADFNDVSRLDLTVDMEPGFSKIFFAVAFGSEEYPEFVGSDYIDAFGIYLNGVNIAFANGAPINVDNPGFAAAPGTELDGVIFNNELRALLRFEGDVPAGSAGNTLTFILADTTDRVLDTTVYISQLSAKPIPEPSTLALAAIGAVGVVWVGYRRRAGRRSERS